MSKSHCGTICIFLIRLLCTVLCMFHLSAYNSMYMEHAWTLTSVSDPLHMCHYGVALRTRPIFTSCGLLCNNGGKAYSCLFGMLCTRTPWTKYKTAWIQACFLAFWIIRGHCQWLRHIPLCKKIDLHSNLELWTGTTNVESNVYILTLPLYHTVCQASLYYR